jgi:hypothetical protein
MSASPKITEYIGRIAPSDKKALYMGYSFIPLFLGNLFAGFISGNVYQDLSDKHTLALRIAHEKGLQISETVSQNELFNQTAKQLDMSNLEFTSFLWNHYHPSNIWWVIAVIGLAAAFGLAIYNRVFFSKQ